MLGEDVLLSGCHLSSNKGDRTTRCHLYDLRTCDPPISRSTVAARASRRLQLASETRGRLRKEERKQSSVFRDKLIWSG